MTGSRGGEPFVRFSEAYDRLGIAGQEALYHRHGGGTLAKRPTINPLSRKNEKNNPGFSLYKSDKGKVLWKDFRSDSSGDLFDFLLKICGKEAARRELGLHVSSGFAACRPSPSPSPFPIPKRDAGNSKQAMAQAVYQASIPDPGALAGYFKTRALTLPLPADILYHAQDAMMVAPVRDQEGTLMGIHRTWLGSGEKKMLGPVAGGTVRLAAFSAGQLLLGEGIESVASAMQATGLPGWAALSTSGLQKVQLPDIAQEVILCADSDRNGAGQKAARQLAQRLLQEGRSVQIAWPCDQEGERHTLDFNDLLQADPSGQSIRDRFDCTEEIQALETSACGVPLAEAEDPWPEPEKLRATLKPVQAFSFKLIPRSLRAWVADISDRMQCPPDFLAVVVMVAMATIIGKKVAIQPKARDSWRVVVNLWGLLIGRPSLMKTPALNEGLKFLERLEIIAEKLHETVMEDWQLQQEAGSMRLDAAKMSAKKAFKNGQEEEGLAILKKGMPKSSQESPECRRYIVTDATIEKLGELLNKNANGLLLKRDEITSFLRNLDREDRAHERGFYLEAFNGDGRYTYDRIGRGTIKIHSVTLSLIGTIQPGRLASYTHSALNMDRNDDGLMQRFQLAVYPDPVDNWEYRDRWPNKAAEEEAWQVFQQLDDLDIPMDEGGRSSIALRFSAEAQALFTRWLTELETTLRSEDMHPAIESHLTKYRSLGPSLALILHLADGHGLTPVGREATIRAFAWCAYLKTHMERIYGASLEQAQVAAELLLKKIKKGDIPPSFKVNDIRDRKWAGLDSNEKVKGALEVLEEHLYLRVGYDNQQDHGGRASLVYRVNPKVLASKKQNTGKKAPK